MAHELKDQNRQPRNKPTNLWSSYSQKFQESYNEKRKACSITCVENVNYLYTEEWRKFSYPLSRNKPNMDR